MQSGLQLDEIYDVEDSVPEIEQQEHGISDLRLAESSLSRVKNLVKEDPALLEYLQPALTALEAKVESIRSKLSPEQLDEYDAELQFNELFLLAEKHAILVKEYRKNPNATLELEMDELEHSMDRIAEKIGSENMDKKLSSLNEAIRKARSEVGYLKESHSPDEDVLREAAGLQNTGDEISELNRKALALTLQYNAVSVYRARMMHRVDEI